MSHRGAIREYVNGSLWVWPGLSAVAALLVGYAVSTIDVSPGSPLAPLAFQGTADDARALLTIIAGTVVTVIALVLGLTVVALQLSSTQFSPRLLRKFLRDRANQIVLSVFVATFVYSSAGLYTVGLAAGTRVEQFPRIAISGAIVLLFASMAMVVYFADHLAHAIQVDAIGARVEQDTLAVVRGRLGGRQETPPTTPPWATPIPATRSGYLQAVHPDPALILAREYGLIVKLRVRVGEHVVAGTVLGWAWTWSPDQRTPDPLTLQSTIDRSVRIGFERTLEQDAALGIRQLVDMACKALSPAVNDPYTAVQAVDHLSVIFAAMAIRPLGDTVVGDFNTGLVIIPGRRFGDYLATMCGLIRRYGSAEPTVSVALLSLLDNCAAMQPPDPDRWTALTEQADLILADAARAIAQPADLVAVQIAADHLRTRLPPPPTPKPLDRNNL
jgi:uncharacterized membrane protein